MNFEDNREWANHITEKLEYSDSTSILEYLKMLENKWEISGLDIGASFTKLSKNFNVTCLDNIDINFIETRRTKSYGKFWV